MKIIGLSDNKASIGTIDIKKEETATRAAVLFLLDESLSMKGSSIKNLNDAINRFPDDVCRRNGFARTNIEIAVMAFTTSTRMVADWKPLGGYTPVSLSAGGGTDISVAMRAALSKVDEKLKNESYKTVHIVLISDGDGGDVTAVAEEVARLKKGGRFVFWMLGVSGYNVVTAQKLTQGEHLYTLSDGKRFDYTDFINILINYVVNTPQYKNPDLVEVPIVKTIDIRVPGGTQSGAKGGGGSFFNGSNK